MPGNAIFLGCVVPQKRACDAFGIGAVAVFMYSVLEFLGILVEDVAFLRTCQLLLSCRDQSLQMLPRLDLLA